VVANADNARGLVRNAAPRMKDHKGPCKHGCQTALEHAIMTHPDKRDPALLAKLDAVAGRILKR
jgi:5'-methylthioadenosine phosphorylase